MSALLWLCAAALTAQTAADSLARLLQRAPADTNRVLLLVDYAWEINETQPHQAERSLREAIALAQRLGYLRGEAKAWNGLGVLEEIRQNKNAAQQHYLKALQLRQQLGDKAEIASSLNNLGVLYENFGQPDSALAYHKQSLAILETLRDTLRIARARFNIAAVLQESGDYTEARSQLYEARAILEQIGDRDGMAKVYAQLGHIYLELDRYREALRWYRQALDLRQQLGEPQGLAMALSDYANALDEYQARGTDSLTDVFALLERPTPRRTAETQSADTVLHYYQRALQLWNQLDNAAGKAQVFTNMADVYKRLGQYATGLALLQQAEAIALDLEDPLLLMEIYNVQSDIYDRMGQHARSLGYVKKYYALARETKNQKFVQSALKDFSEVYSAMGDYARAYAYRVKYDEFRYARLREKERSDFARKEVLYEAERRERLLKEQETALKLQAAELARSRLELYASLAGVIALLVLAALLYSRNRLRARTNRELAAKNAVIERERQRADDLLTNILPAATAAELKAHNRVKPVRYDSVTVMFTDFKGFTLIAENLPSEVLIAELDECFTLFDDIVRQHGLEKIKTIGDAYMCAGGLPLPNDTHPADVVRAAIAMQCQLQALMARKKAEGKPVFEMRIGIHTGPVVAGVVGRHKFAYDIWGDTVNTAARLEQTSEPGKINISETTYQAVKDLLPCTYRGRLSAKNKGEVAMYFVEYTCDEP
ncbi:MAG: adenylate/guanylate cyclase domain-containing protein [Saprospiraceae bacterium]|nr:tetratricopeptide repeat protein [Saprospiraceae bacterium]MDW8228653.1 adenylate/guanylate cyclase domain-containing protein [Saprospiraceae bacterium]